MPKLNLKDLVGHQQYFKLSMQMKKLCCCFLFWFLCDEVGFVTLALVLFGQNCFKTLLSKVFLFLSRLTRHVLQKFFFFVAEMFFDQFLTVFFFKCSVNSWATLSLLDKKLNVEARRIRSCFCVLSDSKKHFSQMKRN